MKRLRAMPGRPVNDKSRDTGGAAVTMVYHHALPVGTRLASYEIRDVLGAGGFGITYMAYDFDLEREVAIKEYLPTGLAVRIADGTTVAPKSEGDSGDFEYGRKRFLDEARTLARFREPNIVRVITYLEAHGTAYFVMDYEAGESLVERLKASVTLTEAAVLRIVIPILRGLSAVHRQSFLHRDIKPHNIYLRRDDSPVLLDFGAARQALGEHSRAMTGLVTPGYAPFEQYLSSGQGPWTDVYALGATMYHCVTGFAPIASTERMAAIHDGKPDPLLEVSALMRERYGAKFIDTMMWMMAPLARDRPQSADQALASLSAEAAASAVSIPSPPAQDIETIDLDAPVVAGGTPWQRGTLKAVELNLEQHIGPLSRVLVKKAAGKTVNVAELTELLSRFIPTERGKTEFLSETRALTGGVLGTPPKKRGGTRAVTKPPRPPRARSEKKAEPKLDSELLHSAEQKLAQYVGPVARVLVKRAQASARDPDSFYQLLAQELTSTEQRSAFLKDVGAK
jgi:serine/threonine protein kinase